MASESADAVAGASKAENGGGERADLESSVAQLRASTLVAFDKALDNILKLPSHDLTIAEDSLLVLGAL